ncbi:ADP-ribosylglycohydrolase family protein [Streptomyces sp. NPDC059909]|uniref:ADP-ribosylglycohydrolase family protein n=1 Tax=Streptomyces sp. NPDC059909 TaxID=3346998 RepID=UPI003648ACE8
MDPASEPGSRAVHVRSDRSWQSVAVRRSRVRGCLLGGAIGDALGNPVEFQSLAAIRREHGERGITGFVPDSEGVIRTARASSAGSRTTPR